MTVHKLTAGDGYTYLTRQVASGDELRPPDQPLAAYYTARGNPPGVWLGSGATDLGVQGTTVSEAQMRALFGAGAHPNRDAMLAAGASPASTRLGRPYSEFAELASVDERVAKRLAELRAATGVDPTAAEIGRITGEEKRRVVRRPVAGYDLVFTPVKSASLLWGLAGPEIRAAVEDAHHAAVRSAFDWIEKHAAFTRTGADGVAQIDTTGLVAAAFDHRESRSADPDLHTHVAISNKVRGVDGRWRALDARSLHALGVAASERYNTRLEDELTRRLGVRFVERGGTRAGKRPVREIDGVPLNLIRHFSRRRAAIEDRYTQLTADFRSSYGREPDRSTQLHLAQQATLETRDGKPQGRTLVEQVQDWTQQATQVLGAGGVARMLNNVRGIRPSWQRVEALDHLAVARRVLEVVSGERATWTRWNIHAETERQLRPFRFASLADREAATETVVAHATGPELSIRIAEPELVAEPTQLRRGSDGEPVFVPHGSERYTTMGVLNAEETLVSAARAGDGPSVDPVVVEAAVAIHESRAKVRLDPGQRHLVAAFATTPAPLAIAIGPAGAGKTTAMRSFAAAWTAGGGRVVPLAASSKAAEVLGSELGTRAENLHKFLYEANRPMPGADAWFRLSPGDMVLVDEAGMAGTLQLAALVDHARTRGAAVRLIGDPGQLAAVAAGGTLRLLESEVGSVRLDRLHRFTNPHEANATLALRAGDPHALSFYTTHHRIESGSRDAMLTAAYDAWATDIATGRTSVLIAATGADVTSLNARARVERVAQGQVEADGVNLHDRNRAGVGDWIVTRANNRHLSCRAGRAWVKNGDTWTVTKRHRDGALTVAHRHHPGKLRLPATYVAENVELAYAATVHRSQGITTDTAHALITDQMTRENLYVASSRGRTSNRWYVATETLLDPQSDHEPAPPREPDEVLRGILSRSGDEQSATGVIRASQNGATALSTLTARYGHAHRVAATEALASIALKALPAALADRVLRDEQVGWLSDRLADATGRGADPVRLLKAAAAIGPLTGARSVAAVLATRLDDYTHFLGIPHDPAPGTSLSGLPSPDVGDEQWRSYFKARARLIANARDAQDERPASTTPAAQVPAPPPAPTRARTQQGRGPTLTR